MELDGDGRILAIRDSKLQPVAVPAEGAELLSSYGGLVWRQPDGTAHFWNGRQTGALPDADFNIDSWHNACRYFTGSPRSGMLRSLASGIRSRGMAAGPLEENYLYLIDQVTGQSYLHTYASGDIYDCGGRRLFSCKKAENPFTGSFLSGQASGRA